MIMHRVDAPVGTALRNGRTFYGYKAICGAPIVAAAPLNKGATVATGPEPHAHCARCFRENAENIDIKLPGDNPLGGDIYDEKGRKQRGPVIEKEDTAAPLGNTEKTLSEENYEWGAPIRRR